MTGKTTTQIDCYACIHRRENIGTAHSRCDHPELGERTMRELLAALRGEPMAADAAEKLAIKGNPHGIRNGWFAWPINFDPTWLENCNGFTPEEEAT